ncbi:MAG: DUF2007 domain-containing protein [Verrucomicrobiales bacterium]|nr:DUF2007 domain-containing protein [Verrucomicrobiales bacterium]
MRKVFESCEQEKVGLFQSILESEGIATLIKNENIAAAEGCGPLDLVLPELWVVHDEDYARALDLLKSFV